MKIKKQIVLAAVLCMAVPTVASGCANSAKSGVEALEAGDYKEAQAQFEKLTEERIRRNRQRGIGDLR